MTSGTLDITEARNQFTRLDERLAGERVIYVTRHNKRVFAVVDLEFLETVLETIEIMSDPQTMKHLQQSLDDIRAGRVYSHDQARRELGL